MTDKINGKAVAEWRTKFIEEGWTYPSNVSRREAFAFLDAIEARDKQLAEAKAQRDAMRAALEKIASARSHMEAEKDDPDQFRLHRICLVGCVTIAEEAISTTTPTPDHRALAKKQAAVIHGIVKRYTPSPLDNFPDGEVKQLWEFVLAADNEARALGLLKEGE